jgi:Mitochondrial carrier protein
MNFDSDTLTWAALGAFRSVVAFPIEHTLEVCRAKNQYLPQQSSLKIISLIFKEKGVRGFIDGALPNLARRFFKETYRWPTIAYLHSLWSFHFPKHLKFDGLGPQLATALCIAAIETFGVLPLERLFLAKVNEEGYIKFYKKRVKFEGISALYRGISITFLRHMNVWGVFMASNHYVKRELHRFDPNNQYPVMGPALANVVVAINLTLFGAPLDFMKVQIQLKPAYQRLKISQTAGLFFKWYGIRGFYAGAPFSLFHTLVHAFLAGNILDKITHAGKS